MTRRLPAEQRRAQLLRAALEIAEHDGLGAVTVRGVAERAGVSLGVVHYCFTDKEELIREVIHSVNQDLHQAAEGFHSVDFGAAAVGAEGLRLRLYEAIDLVWAVVTASPDRQLLTYEIVSYSLRTHGLPEVGLAGDQKDYQEAIIRAVLQRTGGDSGMTWGDDLEEVVAMVLCIVDGVGLRWQVERDDDAAVRYLHRGVDMVAAGATPVG